MNTPIDTFLPVSQRSTHQMGAAYQILVILLLGSCYSPDWSESLTSSDSSTELPPSTTGASLGTGEATGATTTETGDGSTMGYEPSGTGGVWTTSGANSLTGESDTTVAHDITGASDTADVDEIPAPASLTLTFAPIKQFDFEWKKVDGAEYYQLYEQADPDEPYKQILENLDAETVAVTAIEPLHLRSQARYVLRACNQGGCSESNDVAVAGTMAAAVGYFKASNTDALDEFGARLALSADGSTLAVGARGEASSAKGVNNGSLNNQAPGAGAVYVFKRVGKTWIQEAYLKASNTDAQDQFGGRLSLSSNGDTLAIAAKFEDSSSTGIDGKDNNDAVDSGAVYVFTRVDAVWSQKAYIKASNSEKSDNFGYNGLSMSGDGQTLAVGSVFEDSKLAGINNADETDNSMPTSGAVYVFSRAGDSWTQQAYVKASNPGPVDAFGFSISLSNDGDVMAVGAPYEDSDEEGVGGGGLNDGSTDSGAVYTFSRSGDVWTQQAYVKASINEAHDHFGYSVSVSGDGETLAASSEGEDSAYGGVPLNNEAGNAGAVLVFVRVDNNWVQQAYVKASNPGTGDYFGEHVVLSHDGDLMAVQAHNEDGEAQGINGPEGEELENAGAAYVFRRIDGTWSQKAYVKAPNPGQNDVFGSNPALSGDGLTLAVGAHGESSSVMGIGKQQSDNSWPKAGAVYLY